MSKEQGSFEVGVSRHAPKIERQGETVDVRTQEVDIEAAKEELESRVRFLLENLEKSPEGTIMALEPSNVKRAQQTADLFEEKFKELLEGRSDIQIVELGNDEKSANQTLDEIKSNPHCKYIISDLRPTWLIGFKENDPTLPRFNEWKKRLNGDEHLTAKIWALRSGEAASLKDEMADAGFSVGEEELNPKQFEIVPETQILRMITWMKAMKNIGESHFSDRTMILEGVSHNIRSDMTTLMLLGEDVSLESINRVLGGKFRDPFERSSVTFLKDGEVVVAFRDKEKRYSAEEFEKLVQHISDEKIRREKEWNISEIK